MTELACANCLEFIELKKFFDSVSDISSDLCRLTFKCPNCGKIELYKIYKTGISSTTLNTNLVKITKIPHFNGKRTGNIVTLTSHDNTGDKIFSRTIPIRTNAEGEITGQLPFHYSPPEVSNSNSDPYSSPVNRSSASASKRKRKSRKNDDPKILKKIKNGFALGLFSGVITAIYALVIKEPLYFIDVFFVFALSFGILLKSRVCSTVMVFYFIVSKIFMIIESKGRIPAGASVVMTSFLFVYISAMIATYKYHR